MGRLVIRLILGLGLGLGVAYSVRLARAAPLTQSATTWQVRIGAESADQALQAQMFLPTSLTINEGDSVNWTMNVNFVHTITFLSGGERPADLAPSGEGDLMMQNPVGAFPSGGPTYDGTGFVNSGVLQGTGPNFTLTFTQAGSFPYLCLLHPGMVGQIVVQPAGSAYPKTQAQVEAEGDSEASAKLAKAESDRQSVQVASTTNSDGATSYTVVNGIGGEQATVLRFLPGDLTIQAGDSVSFPVQDPHEIHSVTFYDASGPVPVFIEPKEQPNGPPKLLIPYAMPEGGTDVTDSKTLFNSGILGPGQTYTFKFSTPGEYTYVCVIHAPQGMVGKITVTARPTFNWPIFVALGVVLALAAGVWVMSRRGAKPAAPAA